MIQDDIDREIVRILQADGRIANQDLAERVGLSPSPCLRRVRRLEEAGVISGYVALIDPGKVGYGLDVFVRVRLERQTTEAVRRFEDDIIDFDHVQSCYRMVGESDFLLHLVLSGLDEWDDFYMQHLATLDGVANLTSMISMRRVKYSTALPVHPR